MNTNEYEKMQDMARIIPDEESFTHGYDINLINELMRLRIREVRNHEYSSAYIPVSDNAEIQQPEPRTGVKPFMARFWGRLVMGGLHVSMSDDAYEFWEVKNDSWYGISPTLVYGDDKLLGRTYAGMAWAAIQLGITYPISKYIISIDGRNKTVSPNSALVDANGNADAFISVSTPDHYIERIALLKEAFGGAYTALSMAQAYLLLPERSQRFILMEDAGGSGKTSWIHAFCHTWPGLATMGMDTSAMAAGAFAEGNALVPLIGKSVAFSDESSRITEKTFRALAALSTGALKTVRYGSGIAEQKFFKIKMVIASNSLDDLDNDFDSVARRKVIIPMSKEHSESWWRGESPSWSNAACMHDEIFSQASMHAMAIDGIHTYTYRHGVFPDAVSSMTALTPAARDAMSDIMDIWSILTPEVGRELIPVSELAPDDTRGSRRSIRMEVEKVMGVGEARISCDGTRTRYLVVKDPTRFHAVCSRYGDSTIYDNDVKKIVESPSGMHTLNALVPSTTSERIYSLTTQYGIASEIEKVVNGMPSGERIERLHELGITSKNASLYGVSITTSNRYGITVINTVEKPLYAI